MRSPYFTLNKAQRLSRICYDREKMSDTTLQKRIVRLRDFKRYMDCPAIYGNILAKGGYYALVVDPSASGLAPVDMWLHHNIGHALDEAIKERKRRQSIEQVQLECLAH